MRVRRTLGLFLLGWFLGACVSAQDTEPIRYYPANRSYGLPISQKAAEANAMRMLRNWMRDPDSIRAEWEPIRVGAVSDQPFQYDPQANRYHFYAQAHRYFYGYVLRGRVNAKNGFGGYVGFHSYVFVFHDGQVVLVMDDQVSVPEYVAPGDGGSNR